MQLLIAHFGPYIHAGYLTLFGHTMLQVVPIQDGKEQSI